MGNITGIIEAHDAVFPLPVVATVVLLQNNDCCLHGSVPLPLEVASHPLLNEHHKPSQNSVSLLLQKLVILILYNNSNMSACSPGEGYIYINHFLLPLKP